MPFSLATIFALDPTRINPRRGLIGLGLALVILLLANLLGRPGITAVIGAVLVLVTAFDEQAADQPWVLGVIVGLGSLLTLAAFQLGISQIWVAVGLIASVTFGCSLVMASLPALARAASLLNLWLVVADGIGRVRGAALESALSFLIGGSLAVTVIVWRRHRTSVNAELTQTNPNQPLNWRALFQAASQPRSAAFRFALIRGLALAVSTVVGLSLFEVNPIWSSLATLVVVQPDYEQTALKATQRMAGTLLGVLVAMLVLQAIQLPLVIGLLFLAALFGYFTLMSAGYGVASTMITLYLLFGYSLERSDTLLVGLERIGATLFGALIALAAGALIDQRIARSR